MLLYCAILIFSVSLRFIIQHEVEVLDLHSDNYAKIDKIKEPVGCFFKEVSKLWLFRNGILLPKNAEGVSIANSDEMDYHRQLMRENLSILLSSNFPDIQLKNVDVETTENSANFNSPIQVKVIAKYISVFNDFGNY